MVLLLLLCGITYSLSAVPRMIVIAHYNENLMWINRLRNIAPVTVISRVTNMTTRYGKVVYDANDIGKEVTAYLRFIIDNYHDLPDEMAFIHAHRGSWHTTNQDYTLLRAQWGLPYYRPVVPNKLFYQLATAPDFARLTRVPMIGAWPELFQDILGDFDVDHVSFVCCATFIVPRHAVHLQSLETYQFWYQWVKNGTSPYAHRVAWFFEYSWHRIFGQPLDSPTSTICGG